MVCVGDRIDTDMQEGFLRGHGTQVLDGQLVATECGLVERVNKLVSVRPLRQRYSAALGDIVIGRVTEVAGKRWRLDIGARQEVSLQLSSVDLPGGAQRRRTAEDEIKMRTIFKEGDLLSAEVQSLHADGSIALHTRSAKYGKLTGGDLLYVPAALVKRQKHHFTNLTTMGITMILGCNGMVWLAPTHEGSSAAASSTSAPEQTAAKAPASAAEREAVSKAANAVRLLASLSMNISPASLLNVCKVCAERGVQAKDMLTASFIGAMLEEESQQRLQTSL
ncbi:g921 [Coccomyxa viridis]|uniref:G921 protein n=1 Tax=Coccomyxa viridis TaxID=1274662 RepID=A0ABP1FGT8_9CHLO